MIKIIECGRRRVFREISLAFQDALRELGHESKILNWLHLFNKKYECTEEDCEPGEFNIYIHGRGKNMNLRKDAVNICFQTEQFLNNHFKLENRNEWTRVLEIFPPQVNKPKTVYFPMGYSKHFDTDIKQKEDKRFFYFGGASPHRSKFISKHRIFRKTSWYSERDRLILSAKFNVSINLWSGDYYYSPHRGLIIMCKGKFMLQEECVGGYGIYKGMPVLFTRQTFSDIVREWKNKDTIEYGLSVRKTLMENHRFETYLEKAIGDLLKNNVYN